MKDFYQSGPQFKNQFTHDFLLRSYLIKCLPKEIWNSIQPDLEHFGERVATDIYEMGERAEASAPKHIPYDPWGRRVDEISISPAWNELATVAAEEGIVAIGYERKFGAFSRLYQFAKLYLYHPSSAFFSCPLAMTDGAARAIELYGDEGMKNHAFRNITSRDAKKFWTSGQWMTERTGGSDVSGTSTDARFVNGRYELYGTKWFTSATTSQMAMTLARIEGAPAGSKGLSLFYLELRDPSGKLQNIRINRLKDKLGTKALPTAELELFGTPATLVGGEGGGVKKIASLFNITRMYNSICALGAARRALVLARDYSFRREAFGKKMAEHPLHAETFASLVTEFEANFHLTFHLSGLLGKDETGSATESEAAILRLLTPIAKLHTAKSAMAITSEVIEIFGGAGYVEDTGLPRLLRDAQVFSIWEGTTNVLSLDVLRALEKENAFPHFIEDIRRRIARIQDDELKDSAVRIEKALAEIEVYLQKAMKEGPEFIQAGLRAFSFSLAKVFAGSLMLEFADGIPESRESAKRWCSQKLAPLLYAGIEHRKASFRLLQRE